MNCCIIQVCWFFGVILFSLSAASSLMNHKVRRLNHANIITIMRLNIYRKSLLSGYKSKSFNWLGLMFSGFVSQEGVNACEIGVFSKVDTLRNCRIV